jgi:hypothetical protein
VCAILNIFSKMQVLGFGRGRDQEFDEVKDPSKLGIFLCIGLISCITEFQSFRIEQD